VVMYQVLPIQIKIRVPSFRFSTSTEHLKLLIRFPVNSNNVLISTLRFIM